MRSHRAGHGVARRANAILLLDDGKSCQAIAEFLYLDDDTIRGWYKTYREAGWDALSVDGWKGGQSRMTSAQETELCAWLDGRFCRSTVEIRAHILKEFGVEYSHSGCLKLLARLGFEYRKPKGLPRVSCAERLCCTNQLRDSLYESSVVAGGYEQLVPYEVQDQELAFVQHGAKAARFAINLV